MLSHIMLELPKIESAYLVVVIFGALVAAPVAWLYTRLCSRQSILESIPWVAQPANFIERAQTTLWSFFHTRDLVLEGYQRYSKKNMPFVLPNITTGPEVILPLNQMEWLLQQPEDVISQNEVNRAFLQADHTMLHPKVVTDRVHEDVIRTEMTKRLTDHTNDVHEEIEYAFRQEWGADPKVWREVVAYDTMLNVIARISNRVLVGKPLCRNKEYLDQSKNFARLAIVQAVAISLFPRFLRGFVAPWINRFDYLRHFNCCKYVIPMIVARLKPFAKIKNDYIQWCIDHSYANNDPSERTLNIISKRLNVTQFAAIQSSAITLTNLIIDIAASPPETDCLATLRTEVIHELCISRGFWTTASLSRMISLDSVLRESMRLWGFVSRGLLKKVVAKNGVTLPSGEHLPRGTNVGFHAYPIHHDADIYDFPEEFHPFRFCGGEAGVVREGLPLVQTSGTFLAFSHGRHACPGRFFAAQQLKLVLAHIAMHYEIEHIPVRPANQWLVGSQGPPLDFKIRVRHRGDHRGDER